MSHGSIDPDLRGVRLFPRLSVGSFTARAARTIVGSAEGIAAATVLMAVDRGEICSVLQLLVYPMLDDRTAARPDPSGERRWVWTAKSNHFGWSTYLGRPPGSPDVTAYQAPARREDLSGLPPTWIGVGSLDLFRDEDAEYAARLAGCGVPYQLEVIPGAFHGFDVLFPAKPVSADFLTAQVKALAAGLTPA